MPGRWIEVVHPDDRDLCRQKWQGSVSTGDTFEVEYRLRSEKQEFRWYLDRAVPCGTILERSSNGSEPAPTLTTKFIPNRCLKSRSSSSLPP